MKIHCLIPSFFSLDQWQHLPSSPFLLSCFAAKWIAIWFLHLVNPLNGLIKSQDKSEGLVPLSEADGGLCLPGISSPASAFVWQVKPRGFAVISEPFVSFTVIHPQSCLQKDIPNLLCRYPRAVWRLLLPPLPWSKAFQAEVMDTAVCIPNLWVSTSLL